MHDLTTIDRFLQGRRLALVGVSSRANDFSRAVYTELVARGYEVVPVRPGLADIEGARVYARLQDVPGRLDGAILMTAPGITAEVVHDCVEAQVPRVWMHRGAGPGAVDGGAVQYCRDHDIEVIAGECPLMFLPNTTGPHRVHATLRQAIGTYPRAANVGRPSLTALLAHAVLGWTACALIMALLMTTLTTGVAQALHALAAPVLFGFVAAHYFKRSNTFSPLLTATVFVTTVALLDLGIVAAVVLRSFEMFGSFMGVWLPLLLIFAVTLTVGTARLTAHVHRRAAFGGSVSPHG